METEKKPEAPPQAPAQVAAPVETKAEVKPETPVEAQPQGLDGFTPEKLKEFYSKSPQMFEEAGIVPKKEEKPVEVAKPAQSAAPVLDGTEIKLPEDVQVDRSAVDAYLAHAKEIGLNPKQVQAEIDFQVKQAREVLKRQAPQPTAQELDAANVARLKADKEFGAKYEENMEIARRAAMKFGDPELLEKLRTSDPVLVRHFYKLGKADAEDSTRGAPNRNGHETQDSEKSQQDYFRQRYPRSPQMFGSDAE